MSDMKGVTIKKLDTSQEVVPIDGKLTPQAALEKVGAYNPASFTYLHTGKGVPEGGQQLEESMLGTVDLQEGDTVMVLPRVVGGTSR